MKKNSNTGKSGRGDERKPRKQSIARRIIFGSVISSDFIVRHWLKIFVLLLLIMIYISTKYQCQTDMETIRRLSNQLEVVKTERIRQRSTYMSRIRESAMQQLADSVHPGLVVQEQPPFHLDTVKK